MASLALSRSRFYTTWRNPRKVSAKSAILLIITREVCRLEWKEGLHLEATLQISFILNKQVEIGIEQWMHLLGLNVRVGNTWNLFSKDDTWSMWVYGQQFCAKGVKIYRPSAEQMVGPTTIMKPNS